jgi:1,4-dihydroxy-2-naphthoate octaprenyltransferase
MIQASEERVPLRLWLRWRFRALRSFSFPVSVLPVLVATAAVCPLPRWKWDVVAASALGVALLHAAGNLLNDYFDYLSGVDRKVAGDEGRPGRLLVRGELAPKDVLAEALGCLLLAVPTGAYLVWRCGGGILWFGAAAAVALYAYTGPPLRLKYRALGEPLIFLVFGPILVVGAAYAQTGQWERSALLLSIPIGFATTAVLVGNNIRDIEEDRRAGVKTLAQVLGARGTRGLYIALVAASALGLTLIGVVSLGPRLLIAAPVFLLIILKTLLGIRRGDRIADVDMRTAQFESLLLLFTLTALLLKGGA